MVATNDEPTKSRRPRTHIPLPTRLKARNLYLTQGLSFKEIGEKTGLDASQIRSLVDREGWPRLKSGAKSKITAKHDARASEMVSEVVEAMASESEEIALSGLQRARQAVESQEAYAAKDFQSWTGGLRNLVQVARELRGFDSEQSRGSGATLNVFVGRFETVSDKPAEKPAIDV
jgi:hypothetical protein